VVVRAATTIDENELKYRSFAPMMDERMRRCWAATEVREYGWGGVRAVSCATGLSPNTIRKGEVDMVDQQRQAPDHMII
jgi:hypothetical protein